MEEYFSILLGKMVLQSRSWTGSKEHLNRGIFQRKCGRDLSNHPFSGVKTVPSVPQIPLQLQTGGRKAPVGLGGQKESPGVSFLGFL